MAIRMGVSLVTADRFYTKAMRRHYQFHRALADKLGETVPESVPHTDLIISVTDESPNSIEMDLDDEIGIVNVGRDTSVSYKPKDSPDDIAMSQEFADICDRAINAYPHLDAESRRTLHRIVDTWRKGLRTSGCR